MLEVKDLTKRYIPKKGVPVVAVDHINLKFPEKGMVFLLGKSGSGKSTMLNLLGGLDVYDEGDIIIKGKSSKDFKQKDFDSYRNTYLGFIFQEYNILEEFNVGANIALALELQGIKADDERINSILKEVDLEGFGNRKPNELSGGQKQRVAIARALVKDPEIILADEPTGALDSNTGRQILDTLKKLSKEKLVIVVSHDREFAENYADRIVELADGHVISDMEYFGECDDVPENEDVASEGIVFEQDRVVLPAKYHLSESDRDAINAWMDARELGATIEMKGTKRSVIGRKAVATDESKIAQSVESNFKLIKSKLPMKNAFRIGASGLKHKTFRLVITILLSCVAFGLFGLADTFGCYNHVKTCANSIVDSNINYATFVKSVFYPYSDNSNDGYWRYYDHYLSDEDIDKIEADTGLPVLPVYIPMCYDGDFMEQYDESASFTETDYHIYAYCINGYVELNEESMNDMGIELVAGRLADGSKNEIVISSYLAQTFVIGGYRAPDERNYQSIQSPVQMVGKVLRLNGVDYEIVGVVDTGFDLDRYTPLTVLDESQDNLDELVNSALFSELYLARQYSLLQMAMVGEGFVERLAAEQFDCDYMVENGCISYDLEVEDYYMCIYPNYITTLDRIDSNSIVWIDGTKNTLAENEVIVSESDLCDVLNVRELTDEALANIPEFTANGYIWGQDDDGEEDCIKHVKIVGYIPSSVYDGYSLVVMPDSLADKYSAPRDGLYSMAVSEMPSNPADIRSLVEYAFTGEDGIRYELMNSVTYELDGFDRVLKSVGKVFFWIGIFFAIFASVMMATFISSSISYKKQEIGILRAIGARGSDVFRIFFSESFIIAMINFTLSAVGCGVVTFAINLFIRRGVGILVTILRFGPRQVILLLLVSLAVAALASFFPVNHNAKKKPIDAIRNR